MTISSIEPEEGAAAPEGATTTGSNDGSIAFSARCRHALRFLPSRRIHE